jgi:hypothetical protein
MSDGLIAYVTGGDQRAEIEAAAGDWRVVAWAEEDPSAPQPVAARPSLRAATARLVRGEADGLVVRSLSDVSEQTVQHGVLDWYLRLGARFIALRDGLDTFEPTGRRRAEEVVERAAASLRGLPAPGWEARSAVIAGHIAPGSSVLDLGAGTAPLRELVETDRYVPADRASWRVHGDGLRTTWWDPDVGVWPDFGERFDVAVLSGVAEYLEDLDDVLARLPALSDRLIITYSTRGPLGFDALHAMLDRRTRSWEQVAVWQAHRIFAADLRAPDG